MEHILKMPLDKKACYLAFQSHDPRFDGRLYVGVSSTGIYCRPVCRTKSPKEENCTYFTSAAAAQAAGYRPCLRCRPELAPGLAPIDGPANTARKAALMIEDDLLPDSGVEELATALGVTSRHLRRVFADEYGVPPVQYRETYRLLLAKSLLTDTDLPVTDIAFAAGFGSLRRFNTIFLRQCRMPPSALRKETRAQGSTYRDGITLYLGYRPPYRWEDILDFLAGRAIPGVEVVSQGAYARTVALQGDKGQCLGWITVSHARKKEGPRRHGFALPAAGPAQSACGRSASVRFAVRPRRHLRAPFCHERHKPRPLSARNKAPRLF